MMKKGKTLLAVLLMLISVVASASVKIVPEPVEIHEYPGKSFRLSGLSSASPVLTDTDLSGSRLELCGVLQERHQVTFTALSGYFCIT